MTKKERRKSLIALALTILQNQKSHGFNFIWILALGALLADLGGTSLSFSLEAPLAGKIVKARAYSKL